MRRFVTGVSLAVLVMGSFAGLAGCGEETAGPAKDAHEAMPADAQKKYQEAMKERMGGGGGAPGGAPGTAPGGTPGTAPGGAPGTAPH